jgi:hypothetical protein
MPISDDDERDLRVNLMQTQIELYKAQLRWEPWKALAAMIAAAAVFAGSVLALSTWLHPAAPQPPQTIVIQMPPPPAPAAPAPAPLLPAPRAPAAK